MENFYLSVSSREVEFWIRRSLSRYLVLTKPFKRDSETFCEILEGGVKLRLATFARKIFARQWIREISWVKVLQSTSTFGWNFTDKTFANFPKASFLGTKTFMNDNELMKNIDSKSNIFRFPPIPASPSFVYTYEFSATFQADLSLFVTLHNTSS